MHHMTRAILISLCIPALASAQDGGKLNWKGKGGDPKSAMADAGSQGLAMMLFFTSEG